MNFLENCDYDWLDLLNFNERPFRAKLIPSKVWKDLDRYRNDSVGLINYCKKWRTRVEFRPEKSKAKFYETHIAIGGEYGPEERQCIIQIHTDYYDTFKFTDSSWDKFKFKFIQVPPYFNNSLINYFSPILKQESREQAVFRNLKVSFDEGFMFMLFCSN